MSKTRVELDTKITLRGTIINIICMLLIGFVFIAGYLAGCGDIPTAMGILTMLLAMVSLSFLRKLHYISTRT